jgi:hypothetical protein
MSRPAHRLTFAPATIRWHFECIHHRHLQPYMLNENNGRYQMKKTTFESTTAGPWWTSLGSTGETSRPRRPGGATGGAAGAVTGTAKGLTTGGHPGIEAATGAVVGGAGGAVIGMATMGSERILQRAVARAARTRHDQNAMRTTRREWPTRCAATRSPTGTVRFTCRTRRGSPGSRRCSATWMAAASDPHAGSWSRRP